MKAKFYDLAAASPLILWNGLAVWKLAPQLAQQWIALIKAPAFTPAIALASQFTIFGFLGLQVVLFSIRRIPQDKADGISPRLAGLIGSNLQLSFLALPLVHHGAVISSISAALIAAGTGGAIYTLSWLGRSFSIFPQARGLVVRGPYRLIRHPLYLTEQIAAFGAMMQFAQPWALLIALVSFAVQFPRMHYEEQILSKTYPEYAAYKAATSRLVPGLY